MELIQTAIVGAGGQAQIDFTSIPQDFTDLVLKTSLRSAGGSLVNGLRIEFNGNTSSVYSVRNLQAIYNTGANSNSNPYNVTTAMVVSFMPSPSQTANTFSSNEIYIPNYTAATSKSVSIDGVSPHNDAFLSSEVVALNIATGVLASNTAISSIKLTIQEGNNFAQGSTVSLYGVKDVSKTYAKATGGTIYYDSVRNKVVHVFTASGTFTPTQNLTGVEYLVVAGGGGGGGNGNNQPGGGGAGGYRSSVVGEMSGGGVSAESVLSLSAATGYSVTIGAGGAGGVTGTSLSTNGSNSVFGAVTSLGGGRGATGTNLWQTPLSGGSGGGGGPSGAGSDVSTGAAGTSGQGFAGGSAFDNSGSGGGGAGEAGNTDGTGAGGDGVASSITGASVFRSGGGATRSAAGGDGGGGNPNTSGAANTGGGGGAGVSVSTAGSGGSGIVIVRYSA